MVGIFDIAPEVRDAAHGLVLQPLAKRLISLQNESGAAELFGRHDEKLRGFLLDGHSADDQTCDVPSAVSVRGSPGASGKRRGACGSCGKRAVSPVAAAISALCSPCGAIIGRVFLKQELNFRMIVGIIICFAAGCVISGTTFDAVDMTQFIGMLITFIAAIGWGFEGAIGGYGVCMMDSQIGITIREITSGLANIIIMVPVLSLIGLAFGGHGISEGLGLLGSAFTDSSVIWFVLSGLCCGLSFMLWYKGNSMCGAALGMACNAMYSFWVPLCCWILMGVIGGEEGWALSPIQWVMAVVIVFGIWLIAMNPLDLFKKEED